MVQCVYRSNVLAQPEMRHTVYLSLTSITLNRCTDSFVNSVTIFLVKSALHMENVVHSTESCMFFFHLFVM